MQTLDKKKQLAQHVHHGGFDLVSFSTSVSGFRKLENTISSCSRTDEVTSVVSRTFAKYTLIDMRMSFRCHEDWNLPTDDE